MGLFLKNLSTINGFLNIVLNINHVGKLFWWTGTQIYFIIHIYHTVSDVIFTHAWIDCENESLVVMKTVEFCKQVNLGESSAWTIFSSDYNNKNYGDTKHLIKRQSYN